MSRRWLDPASANDLGQLDTLAIERVRAEADVDGLGVLVVDDNAAARANLQSMLVSQRFEACAVADGLSALVAMADAQAQVSIGRFRMNGNIGFVPEGAVKASITRGNADDPRLLSRTFWMGVDPTQPGIPDRHSTPRKSFATQKATNSSHGSPATAASSAA